MAQETKRNKEATMADKVTGPSRPSIRHYIWFSQQKGVTLQFDSISVADNLVENLEGKNLLSSASSSFGPSFSSNSDLTDDFG